MQAVEIATIYFVKIAMLPQCCPAPSEKAQIYPHWATTVSTCRCSGPAKVGGRRLRLNSPRQGPSWGQITARDLRRWGCLLSCAMPVQFGESPLNLIDSRNDWSGSERGTRKGGVPARAWREDGRHVPDDCLLSSGSSGLPAACIPQKSRPPPHNRGLLPQM